MRSPQDFLDDNQEILCAKDRKQISRVFRGINHGKPEFVIDFARQPTANFFFSNECWLFPGADSCVRYLGLIEDEFNPEEFYEQWERDRAKKAERKHLRELDRSAAGQDLLGSRKGNKKQNARKDRLNMGLEMVVGLMRQFVADTAGDHTHTLPPMDKKMRKAVHDLANAFNLKSESKGSGTARFTTLTKTTWSGKNVDEKKIARILDHPSSYVPVAHEGGKGEGWRGAGKRRPRDGEVVGEVRFLL